MKPKTNFKETNNEDNFTLAMEHRPTHQNATRKTLIRTIWPQKSKSPTTVFKLKLRLG
jgi:hypothetical protein